MKKENNARTRNTIIFTIALLGLIAVCIGGSYAYFTATAKSNVQTITTGTLSATYNTGQDINATGIIPVSEAQATEHHFSIMNNGSDAATLKLSFVELSLTKEGTATTSGNLKWALYDAGSDYTITGNAIAAGDFSSVSSPMVLKNDIAVESKGTKYYVLKIWLNETGTEQNVDQGMTFSAKIQADMQ